MWWLLPAAGSVEQRRGGWHGVCEVVPAVPHAALGKVPGSSGLLQTASSLALALKDTFLCSADE